MNNTDVVMLGYRRVNRTCDVATSSTTITSYRSTQKLDHSSYSVSKLLPAPTQLFLSNDNKRKIIFVSALVVNQIRDDGVSTISG